MAKPTKEELGQKLEQYRRSSAALFRKWSQVDSYLHGTFPVWDTEAWPRAVSWEQYRPSVPYSIWARARDRMTTAVPIVRRPVWGTSQERKAVADEKVEPWLNAGLRYMMRCDPAFKQAWSYGMLYGIFVIQGPVKEAFKDDYHPKARTFWPARFHAPHPATVLLDPLGPVVPREVFQFSVMEASVLRAHIADLNEGRKAYGGELIRWENDDARQPLVSVCEYWNQDYHAVFTGGGQGEPTLAVRDASTESIGELLYVVPNLWGFVPYAQSPTGWGPVKKDASLQEAWAQACTGVIDPIMDDLLTNAQTHSGIKHQFLNSVFAGVMTQEEPGEMEQAVREGAFVRVNNPGDVRPIPVNEIKPFMENFERAVSYQIQETSLANEFGGFGEVRVPTLGQQMLNLSEANKRFTFPKERLEAVCTAAVSNLLRFNVAMREHYPSTPMKIMGLELSESDLEGDYSVEVEFRVIDPVTKSQVEQDVLRKYAAGLIDSETALVEMGYENSQEIRKRRLVDEVLASPYAHAEALANVAKELGLRETEAHYRREAARLLAQMQAQGAAAPSSPNQPAQATAPAAAAASPVVEALERGLGRGLAQEAQIRRQRNGAEALMTPPQVG